MRAKNLHRSMDAYFTLAPMLRQKVGVAEEVESCVNYLGEAYMRAIVKEFGNGDAAMRTVRHDFEPHLYNWIAQGVLSNGALICDKALNPPLMQANGTLLMRLYYALAKSPEPSSTTRYLEFESVDLHASQGRFDLWRSYGRGF